MRAGWNSAGHQSVSTQHYSRQLAATNRGLADWCYSQAGSGTRQCLSRSRPNVSASHSTSYPVHYSEISDPAEYSEKKDAAAAHLFGKQQTASFYSRHFWLPSNN